MKKCLHCNILVDDHEDVCPLCFHKMQDISNTAVMYPTYTDIIQYKKMLKNIPLFITLICSIICIFVNFFTYTSGSVLWSVIVVTALIYSLTMYHVLQKQMRLGSKILYSYLLLSVFLIVIDLVIGMVGWSIDYVLPFLTITTLLTLMILAISSNLRFAEYFGYILVLASISLLFMILSLCGLTHNTWGSFIALLFSIMIAIGLYLFANKTLKDEVRKRFHR